MVNQKHRLVEESVHWSLGDQKAKMKVRSQGVNAVYYFESLVLAAQVQHFFLILKKILYLFFIFFDFPCDFVLEISCHHSTIFKLFVDFYFDQFYLQSKVGILKCDLWCIVLADTGQSLLHWLDALTLHIIFKRYIIDGAASSPFSP